MIDKKILDVRKFNLIGSDGYFSMVRIKYIVDSYENLMRNKCLFQVAYLLMTEKQLKKYIEKLEDCSRGVGFYGGFTPPQIYYKGLRCITNKILKCLNAPSVTNQPIV
jgi:hypothetical protein